MLPLLLGFASSCTFGLIPNATDPNNPEGLVNALLMEVEAASGPIVTLGGSVSGLSGSGLLLVETTSGATASPAADGSFTFSGDFASATSYTVAISSQPTGPHQTCVVTAGTGSMSGTNVSDVAVSCTTNTYTIGVNVTGLAGAGLTLQNNGGDDLAVAADGTYAFATAIASGDAYSVTVSVQPTGPTQTCAVSGGSGTVVGGNVTGITVNCATSTYTIGGNVSGLNGTGLVLQNNGGDNLNIGANGTFSFATPVASGAGYAVTVLTHPSSLSQTCNVTNAAGTVTSSNVTNVNITCVTNTYTIGGSISGLSGSGLTLLNNGGDALVITGGSTSFTFATPISSGGTYNVTLSAQPTSPWQTCNVTGNSGSVVSGNITTVSVNCTSNSYSISGTVNGYSGGNLQLQNGAETLNIGGAGGFGFGTPVTSGTTYNVTVPSQPTNPWQTCTVTGGSGTMAGANVTGVTVNCVTNTYTVGGSITNLTGTLELYNNGGDDLTITAGSTNFTFAPNYGSLAAYNVTVKTQPAGQTCTVTNATGSLSNANITNVSINCVTTAYTIGGTVSGATGSVTFSNNLESTTVSGNGAFTFPTPQTNGTNYFGFVTSSPSGQGCWVVNGSGTIAGANVTNFNVNCGNFYPVNGTISGLTGSGLWLGLNGYTLAVLGPYSSNGGINLASIPEGASYSVSISTQPSGQTCTVVNGSGTVPSGGVTNIQINCI